MSATQILGAVIVALPFFAVFMFFAREEGLFAALTFFAGVAVTVAVLGVGCYLLTGGQ